MNEFLVSTFSSIISSTVVYPIDLLKTQIQVNQVKNINKNVFRLSKNIYRNQGVRGFFNGLTPFVGSYPFFWGTYFYMNQYKLDVSSNVYCNKMFNAFTSATVASVLTNPLFVLKTRLQTDSLSNQTDTLTNRQHIKNIIQNEGVLGFYKGLSTTVGSHTKLAVQFPMYDLLKEKGYSTFYASLIAKTVTSTVFYPLDLIRTNQRDSKEKLKFVDAYKTVIRNKGVAGLYKGVILYNMVTAPNFILMMVLIDKFNKLLQQSA